MAAQTRVSGSAAMGIHDPRVVVAAVDAAAKDQDAWQDLDAW